MKAITFLGATKAYDTTYVLPDGREHTAPFFGVALARFYPGVKMCVFVTEEAKQMHFSRFSELVEDYVEDLTEIAIPSGKNEAELWQVFESVVDAVEPNEQVVFDITHGFRSLPFLSFLSAAYLRVVKKIDLVSVLYGNFEASDKNLTPYRTPVIDMTSFVGLLDWMIAADRFMRFGDATDLSVRLGQTKPDYRTATQEDFRTWKETGVSELSRTLGEVSQSLALIRPYDAMAASDSLRTEMPRILSTAGQLARPLTSLSQHIVDTFAPIALDSKRAQQDNISALTIERNLINWYLERKQIVQASAVAREWLVSYVMIYAIGTDAELLNKDQRELVTRLLGLELQKLQGESISEMPDAESDINLTDVPQLDRSVRLYGQLGEARNDLMHAGKRTGALAGKTLAKKIEGYCIQLNQLGLPLISGKEA